VSGEHPQDRLASVARDAMLGEELPVQVGIAQPDHRSGQPDRVQRRREDLDHVRRSLRSLDADQLHPSLQELPHLSTLGTDGAIGVADVAEAKGRLGVAEPR
jgi:hypothetical protein